MKYPVRLSAIDCVITDPENCENVIWELSIYFLSNMAILSLGDACVERKKSNVPKIPLFRIFKCILCER